VVGDEGIAGSGPDAEERKFVAFRVRNEVAAGVGDPIDFMEGIREVGNAREPHGFTVSRLDPANANGRIIRSKGALMMGCEERVAGKTSGYGSFVTGESTSVYIAYTGGVACFT
jgi:hypothetical protein